MSSGHEAMCTTGARSPTGLVVGHVCGVLGERRKIWCQEEAVGSGIGILGGRRGARPGMIVFMGNYCRCSCPKRLCAPRKWRQIKTLTFPSPMTLHIISVYE